MIRRHLTPALLLATALLLTCYLLAPGQGSWLTPVAPAGVLAAAAIVMLRSPSASFRRRGVLALSASFGLLLGATCLARMHFAKQGAFLPVPIAEATEFSCWAKSDSALSRTGDTALSVSLREVSSRARGVSANARGEVLVLVSGDYRFFLGEALSIRAGLKELDSKGLERFVARAGRDDLRRDGFISPVWSWRARARGWLHAAISRTGYPASALLEALLIGAREDVPESLSEGFRRTGSLHILALSGLHVTVIYGVFSFLLGFFRVRALRFACAAIVILFYQFLAGYMPSLVRATAMILIGGAAMLLDRDQEPLNLLALACIGIVLGDPFQAFSLSFQLSFLALLGMLVLGPLIRFPLEGRLPRFLITAIAASAAAQAATLPLVIARFGVYYPSGLVASLVLVPLTTALLWAGLGWIPIYAVPWPWLHDACASAFAILYTLIDASARVLSWFPGIGFADFVVPWAVAGSCAVLVCLGILLPVRLRGAAPGIRAGGAAPGIRAGGAAPGIRAGGAAQ